MKKYILCGKFPIFKKKKNKVTKKWHKIGFWWRVTLHLCVLAIVFRVPLKNSPIKLKFYLHKDVFPPWLHREIEKIHWFGWEVCFGKCLLVLHSFACGITFTFMSFFSFDLFDIKKTSLPLQGNCFLNYFFGSFINCGWVEVWKQWGGNASMIR